MPAWQTIEGQPPMIVTTHYDHPLDTEGTVKRYILDDKPVQWTGMDRAVAFGQSDYDTGYWVMNAVGKVAAFGTAVWHTPKTKVSGNNWVGMTVRPAGDGYWIANATGRVVAAGAANLQQDKNGRTDLAGRLASGDRVVAIERAPNGSGYWLLTSFGKVYGFGSASGYGSLSGVSDAVALVSNKAGNGYWVARGNGAVKNFGSTGNYGSVPATEAAAGKGVAGMAVRPDERGYWLVGRDGRIWTLPVSGTTANYGSTGGYQPRENMEITSMGRRATGSGRATKADPTSIWGNDQNNGYYLLAADGGVIDLGNAVYYGHLHWGSPS